MRVLLAASLLANAILLVLLIGKAGISPTVSGDIRGENSSTIDNGNAVAAEAARISVQRQPDRDEPGSPNAPDGPASMTAQDARAELPALPGLAGYDVTNPMLPPDQHPAILLAAEHKDHAWAATMESAILGKIQEHGAAPTNLLQVECRMTWCGLVVDLPPGEDRSQRIAIGDELREELEFSRISRFSFGRRNGSSYFAIYFQAER